MLFKITAIGVQYGCMNIATAVEYFNSTGLRVLSNDEEQEVSKQYSQELKAGLEGKQSSLAMLPSLLSSVSLSTISDGKEAVVIEVGGSTVYAARVRMQNKKPSIVASTKETLTSTHFKSSNQFFSMLAQSVNVVLGETAPDAIGVVYSFPGKAVRKAFGVDVISSETLSKDFVIPGISKEGVGEALKKELRKLYGFNMEIPTVVLNDTVAVLFSAGAKIGGVVGTGFNLAMQTPIGVVNSESGGFALDFIHKIAKRIDEKSTNKGKQLAEKQISGLYLGRHMEEIMQQLGFEVPKDISAQYLSKAILYEGNDAKKNMIKEVAALLRNRSAQLVGIMIGTICTTFPEIFTDSYIEVPIEGSLFWKMPGYKEKVEEVAQRISQKKIHFVNVHEAGRIGAAIAALSLL